MLSNSPTAVTVSVALVLAFFAITLAAAGQTVVSKRLRDRREKASTLRRGHYLWVCGQKGVDEQSFQKMFDQVAESADAQRDLFYILDRNLELGRPLVGKLGYENAVKALDTCTRNRTPVTRGRCALLLGMLGADQYLPSIAALISDKDPDVRLAAVRAVALLKTDEAAGALLDAMAHHTGDGGDIAWERLAERLAYPWALPTLRKRLSQNLADGLHTVNHDSSIGLVAALGLVGDDTDGDDLAHVLVEGNLDQRVTAARALRRCYNPHALPALLAGTEDEAAPVRAQVVATLGTLAARKILTPEQVVDVLRVALHDHGWWVRRYAGEGLSRIGQSGVVALQQVSRGDDAYAAQRAQEQLRLLALGDTSDVG